MTKRQKRARVRQVEKELLAQLMAQFPLVEPIGREEWPDGHFILEVYTPHDDEFDIMRSVADRLVDLSVDEGLHVHVFAMRAKPSRHAA